MCGQQTFRRKTQKRNQKLLTWLVKEHDLFVNEMCVISQLFPHTNTAVPVFMQSVYLSEMLRELHKKRIFHFLKKIMLIVNRVMKGQNISGKFQDSLHGKLNCGILEFSEVGILMGISRN